MSRELAQAAEIEAELKCHAASGNYLAVHLLDSIDRNQRLGLIAARDDERQQRLLDFTEKNGNGRTLMDEVRDFDSMPLMQRMGWVDRNLTPLVLWQECLTSDGIELADLTAALLEAWTMAEFPLAVLSAEQWEEMFYSTGYLHDGKQAEPPTEIVLYRGVGDKDFAAGMSWTADIDQARWFAGRFVTDPAEPGYVYRITAPASCLLAYIGTESGRGEDEYIVSQLGMPKPELIEMVTARSGGHSASTVD